MANLSQGNSQTALSTPDLITERLAEFGCRAKAKTFWVVLDYFYQSVLISINNDDDAL